ncbi:fructosamine kinase family protein [Flammeovirgaceae bacterium SG7u.111]|nr:fructosamine kinase family protein [Flammeovirgaceae bacterium SG7u.132]WPO34280.1 fructosamine kinase family protein [Flammeovirgaceae bacterium SG7u.111]
MFEFSKQEFYEKALSQVFEEEIAVLGEKNLSGGCVNNATKLKTTKGVYCIKWNQSQPKEMFAAEQEGLFLMIKANAIKIPKPIGVGEVNQIAFLVLEYIESSVRSSSYWEDLGKQLAQMHRSKNEQYGLSINNFIGSLPQTNTFKSNWIDFFVENRLEPQFRLAIESGVISKTYLKKLDALAAKLPNLLVQEHPSLVHGDLWNGNLMVGEKGEPCLIDPATYFGHREVDLAMTKLFGGFSHMFYQAYQETYPTEKGLEERLDIYNLYPLLVHVNLFGVGYMSGVDSILRKYT